MAEILTQVFQPVSRTETSDASASTITNSLGCPRGAICRTKCPAPASGDLADSTHESTIATATKHSDSVPIHSSGASRSRADKSLHLDAIPPGSKHSPLGRCRLENEPVMTMRDLGSPPFPLSWLGYFLATVILRPVGGVGTFDWVPRHLDREVAQRRVGRSLERGFSLPCPRVMVRLADSIVTPSGPPANFSVTSPSKFLPRSIPIATSFVSPWWRVVNIRGTLSLNVFSASP